MANLYRKTNYVMSDAEVKITAGSLVRIFNSRALVECDAMIAKMSRDPSGTENWQRIHMAVRGLAASARGYSHSPSAPELSSAQA